MRANDGTVLGDQDRVVAVDGQKTGHLFVNLGRIDCVRREFRSIAYHPEVWRDIPEHFHMLLRLPNCAGPGVDFDGQFLIEEHVAALNLDPPKPDKKSRRPVQTELTPTGPWTPASPAVDNAVAE